jgi:hypothetical protein
MVAKTYRSGFGAGIAFLDKRPTTLLDIAKVRVEESYASRRPHQNSITAGR